VDLTIRVRSHSDEGIITVADQGPGMPSPSPIPLPLPNLGEGGGHGLRNVDERLRKIYGKAYGLEIRDNEPQGTVVMVKVPALAGPA